MLDAVLVNGRGECGLTGYFLTSRVNMRNQRARLATKQSSNESLSNHASTRRARMCVIPGIERVDSRLPESIVSLDSVGIVVHVSDALILADALSISDESTSSRQLAVRPSVVRGRR